MKHAKADVQCNAKPLPEIEFCQEGLTAFSGLLLFGSLRLFDRLRRVIAPSAASYDGRRLFTLLIVTRLLGFRAYRHLDPHAEDPIIKRVCRLERLVNDHRKLTHL